MLLRFDTFEGKDLEPIIYTDAVTVMFDDLKWYITRKLKNGKVKEEILDLDDYTLTYAAI